MERTLSNPGEGSGSRGTAPPDKPDSRASHAAEAVTAEFFRLLLRLTGHEIGRYH